MVDQYFKMVDKAYKRDVIDGIRSSKVIFYDTNFSVKLLGESATVSR